MFQDLYPQLLTLSTWQLIGLAIGFLFAIEVGQSIFTSLYNVLWHPLRRFPGSKLDAGLSLLRDYDISRGYPLARLIRRHEEYGDVVRAGPNVLSYNCVEAWKDIFGHSKDLPKAIAFSGFAEHSIFVAPKSEHARQRRIMSPAFTDKALAQQEHLLRGYVDLLITRLKETNGEPTNAVTWYSLTAFDMFGDLAFGKSFQGLEKKFVNPWIKNISKTLHFLPYLAIIKFSKFFGLLVKVVFGPMMKATKEKQATYVKDLLNERLAKDDRGDFMDHLRGKLTEEELIANADIFMIGGSHTSSVFLSGLTYWLTRTPTVFATLKREIRDSFDDGNQITFQTAEQLVYMQAVIEEGLRIFPPVPISMDRKTIAPTKICGQIVPPNTFVGISHLVAFHSEKNFHKANEFHPERWFAKDDANSPFANDKTDMFHPFQYGPRDCIGQHLAYHEIRLILCKMIWYFDIELEPECLRWNEQRIFGIWELPPLKVRYLDRFKASKQ